MARNVTRSYAVGGVTTSQTRKASHKGAKARARAIVEHIDEAIARKSGTDITDLSDADLIADLRRHRTRD